MDLKDKPESYRPLRWTKCLTPIGTPVYLTQRPDRADPPSVSEFIFSVKPSARFCFCDDLSQTDETIKVPMHWYPWVPGEKLPVEHVFAFLCLMGDLDKGDRPIWLHCDSSSMRAPTFLGLYLLARWPKKIISIERAFEGSSPEELEVRVKYSKPSYYARTSMAFDPGVRELIQAWQENGMMGAYEQFMKKREV